MRVTERRMMEVAAAGMSKQREKAAEAGDAVSTGVRVSRPSQDVAGWTEGARARARAAMSDARGSAIGSARDNLGETDRALDGIGGILSRASELATQLANGTYSDQQRADAVTEVNQLRTAALGFARTVGTDGSYVLGGTASTTSPFDTSGAYVGNASERTIEVGEGERQSVTVPGSKLTAAAGVDIFAVLEGFATSLTANDVTGIGTALAGLHSGIAQVASARSAVGERAAALDRAESARSDFELSLTKTHERAVMADPVTAASELAQTQQAFEASRTVAEQIISMFRRG